MTEIIATFDTRVYFDVPKDVYLLSEDENEHAEDDVYGKWWIKWATLFYIDKSGTVNEITGHTETDSKWPTNVIMNS